MNNRNKIENKDFDIIKRVEEIIELKKENGENSDELQSFVNQKKNESLECDSSYYSNKIFMGKINTLNNDEIISGIIRNIDDTVFTIDNKTKTKKVDSDLVYDVKELLLTLDLSKNRNETEKFYNKVIESSSVKKINEILSDFIDKYEINKKKEVIIDLHKTKGVNKMKQTEETSPEMEGFKPTEKLDYAENLKLENRAISKISTEFDMTKAEVKAKIKSDEQFATEVFEYEKGQLLLDDELDLINAESRSNSSMTKEEKINYISECKRDFKETYGRVNPYEMIGKDKRTSKLVVLTNVDKKNMNKVSDKISLADSLESNFDTFPCDLDMSIRLVMQKYKYLEKKSVNSVLEGIPFISLSFSPGQKTNRFDKDSSVLHINKFDEEKGAYKTVRLNKNKGTTDKMDWSKIPNTRLLLENIFPTGSDYISNQLAHQLQFPNIKIPVVNISRGVPGAGKGVFIKNVLVPVFGKSYVNEAVEPSEVIDGRNLYLREKMCVVFDEMQTSKNDADKVEMYLKLVATEDKLSIRNYGEESSKVNIYASVWIFSNKEKVTQMSEDDRRNNVFECNTKLVDKIEEVHGAGSGMKRIHDKTTAFVNAIESEREEFINQLSMLRADMNLIKRLIHTKARDKMIEEFLTVEDNLKLIFVKGDSDRLDELLETSTHDMSFTEFNNSKIKLNEDLENGYITSPSANFIYKLVYSDMESKDIKYANAAKLFKSILPTEYIPSNRKVKTVTGAWVTGFKVTDKLSVDLTIDEDELEIDIEAITSDEVKDINSMIKYISTSKKIIGIKTDEKDGQIKNIMLTENGKDVTSIKVNVEKKSAEFKALIMASIDSKGGN